MMCNLNVKRVCTESVLFVLNIRGNEQLDRYSVNIPYWYMLAYVPSIQTCPPSSSVPCDCLSLLSTSVRGRTGDSVCECENGEYQKTFTRDDQYHGELECCGSASTRRLQKLLQTRSDIVSCHSQSPQRSRHTLSFSVCITTMARHPATITNLKGP